MTALYRTHNKYKNKIAIYDDMLKAIENQKESKKLLIYTVENLFGNKVAEQVEKGNIWEKMPKYLLKIALGEPHKEEEFLNNGKKYSKWFYLIHDNTNSELRYTLQITLDDKGVLAWEESNKDVKMLHQ